MILSKKSKNSHQIYLQFRSNIAFGRFGKSPKISQNRGFFIGVPLYEKSKNPSKSIKIWAKLKVNLMWIFGFCAQKYQFYDLFPLNQEMWKKHDFHFFLFCDLKKVHFSKITLWWFSNIWSFRTRGRGGVNWNTLFFLF